MSNNDLISRQWCLDEYDKRHVGAPGGARKIMEEAPAVDVPDTNVGECQTCARSSDHVTDGTRCPIEEHYALPKDGYCHLYEPFSISRETAKLGEMVSKGFKETMTCIAQRDWEVVEE